MPVLLALALTHAAEVRFVDLQGIEMPVDLNHGGAPVQ